MTSRDGKYLLVDRLNLNTVNEKKYILFKPKNKLYVTRVLNKPNNNTTMKTDNSSEIWYPIKSNVYFLLGTSSIWLLMKWLVDTYIRVLCTRYYLAIKNWSRTLKILFSIHVRIFKFLRRLYLRRFSFQQMFKKYPQQLNEVIIAVFLVKILQITWILEIVHMLFSIMPLIMCKSSLSRIELK